MIPQNLSIANGGSDVGWLTAAMAQYLVDKSIQVWDTSFGDIVRTGGYAFFHGAWKGLSQILSEPGLDLVVLCQILQTPAHIRSCRIDSRDHETSELVVDEF